MTQPASAPPGGKVSKPAGKRLFARLAKAGRHLFGKNAGKTAKTSGAAKPAPLEEKDWRAVLTGDGEKACPATVFRQLSEDLRLAGDFTQADRICARGLEIHPDNLWLVMIHARIADSMEDPDLRLVRWQRVIEVGGDKAPCKAFKNLADRLQARGEFNEAEAVVRRGMALFPEDANLEERLARISFTAGFTATAISRWTDLIAHHPEIDNGWIFRKIGEALCSEGLLDRAVAVLNQGLVKYPEDPGLKEALARLAFRRGDPVAEITKPDVDYTAHLVRDRAEPFGRGKCTFPFALNGMNQHVPAMLDFEECIVPFRDGLRAAEVDVFTTWGASTTHPHDLAIRLAETLGKPHLCLEYGFISSLGLAINQSPQHSIIVCPDSIYFDATRPSALENRLNSADYRLEESQRSRVEACMKRIVRHRITKYNHAPQIDLRERFPANGRKRVLLVDQRLGDLSVAKGLAGMATFERMWEAALALPDHEVIVKLHPDAISGGQGSYFGRLVPDPLPPNVTLVDFDVNPFCLFEVVDKVWVCSSQLGFEALMAGLEVDCFGVPFYAGWGLANDRVVIPRRHRRRSIEEIFHLFYIVHSRYFVPGRGVAEIEDLIGHLVETRTSGENPEPPLREVQTESSAPGEVAVATEPLRILIILPSPRQGASGRYIQTLAWSLCRLGCRVTVLAEGKSPLIEAGVGWLPLTFDGMRLAASVRDEIVAFAPHIVYENGVRSRSQRAALEIMALTGARLAMQSEDDDAQVYETHHGKAAAEVLTLVDKPVLTLDDITRYLELIDLKHSLNVLLDPAYDRWVEPVTRALCYRLASLHTAIWKPFEERLAQEYGMPTLVVPPVASEADFERIAPSPDERAAMLSRHGIPSDSVVIFIGGALYNYSDEFAVFLDALNRTAEKTAASIALIVTPGRSALPIGRMARERLRPEIAFADIDLTDDGDYMEMLKACDVVCSPGLPDTFNRFRLPSRLVKAMAMAKPVLTCRCGFGESLDHGVNAFLMDGTDPGPWADAISLCLDREKRKFVGEQGRIFAVQHFETNRVAAALKEKIEALMAAPERSLADGIDLGPTASPGGKVGISFTESTIKLRDRFHFSMRDSIRLFATQNHRVDTVLHIGAGRCGEFEDYCRMSAKRVILIEASPALAAHLKELEDHDGGIVVKQAIVSGTRKQRPAFFGKNTRQDSEGDEEHYLLRPTRLLEWKPAIRIEREENLATITLSEVCGEIDPGAPDNLLVLELNGLEAEALASTPGSLLQRFHWIAMRVSEEPLYENGATRAMVEGIMDKAGFAPMDDAPSNFLGLLATTIFRRK